MAVSAKFVADFSSFTSAVDKAETKLSEFRLESVKVEGQLRRMADSFSGKKILSDATLAAKAVEDLGGVSKLTAQEQSRLNATVTEAIAKYKALGQAAPKHLQDLAAATKPATTGLSSMLGVIKQIGPALGLSLSVGSVIAFAKSIGDFSGKMLDLKAQTQIATDRLQAFDIVAGDVGLTVDDVVTSADQLAKRLGGDDKSVNEALAKLNLRSEDLKKLSLDQVLFEIDKAMLGVGNQFDRARLYADLFGRTGAQLGRIMDGSLEQVIKSVEKTRAVIDEDLLKKADEVADAWGRAWKRFRAEALVAIGAVTAAISNTVFLGNFRQGTVAPIAPLASHAEAPKMIASHGAEMKKVEETTKKTMEHLSAAAEKQNEWNAAIKKANDGWAFMLGKLVEIPHVMSQGVSQAFQLADVPAKMIEGLTSLPALIKSQGISDRIGDAIFSPNFFSGFTSGFKDLWSGMSGGKGIGGMFSKIGTGISEGFGNLISGGLTNLIGGGINLLGKGFSALFGKLTNSEGRKVNDLRDAALAAAGGFEELNTKAFQAGTTLQKVLDAKKVKDYDAAWADLQDTLVEFEADQARLQTATEKYGFSLAELGPQLQASRLNEQAKELIEDWRVLVGAGINVALVNEKMAASINEYLQTALSVGAEVPAAFRPVLEAMAKQGTLIDANGELITDLEDAGVTFAETMTQGFDRVVQKLDEMIQRLGLAGQAIANLPSVPSVDIGGVGGWGQSPDVLSAGDLPGYAGGTRGRYLDFKGGTPVVLHGRERVMTEGEQAGGSMAALAASLDGIDRRISLAVTRGVTDALILAPRR